MKEEIERLYYYNGQLGLETPYKNGKVHGLAKSWYQNGQLYYELPLNKNLQCGARIVFEY